MSWYHSPLACKTQGSIKWLEKGGDSEGGRRVGGEEIVSIDIWVMERMRSLNERGIGDKEEEEKQEVRGEDGRKER